MPPLADPQLLDCFKGILSNWHVTGYVTAKDQALEWAADNLNGFTLKALARLMNEHILAGGDIDQVRETRQQYNDRDYHYDFRLFWVDSYIYIETILMDDDPADPILKIVSIHDV